MLVCPSPTRLEIDSRMLSCLFARDVLQFLKLERREHLAKLIQSVGSRDNHHHHEAKGSEITTNWFLRLQLLLLLLLLLVCVSGARRREALPARAVIGKPHLDQIIVRFRRLMKSCAEICRSRQQRLFYLHQSLAKRGLVVLRGLLLLLEFPTSVPQAVLRGLFSKLPASVLRPVFRGLLSELPASVPQPAFRGLPLQLSSSVVTFLPRNNHHECCKYRISSVVSLTVGFILACSCGGSSKCSTPTSGQDKSQRT